MRRLCLLLLAGLLAPVTAPAQAEPAADGPCVLTASGLIGERWRALNAGRGPLGCPTTAEEAVPNTTARRQGFEHGEVVHSPAQGGKMVVSAYLERNEVVLDWGSTQGYTYNLFLVAWQHAGLSRLESVFPGPRDHGTYTMPLTRGPGRYEFFVMGCDGVPASPLPCRQGATTPVAVTVPDLTSQPVGCGANSYTVGGLIGQRWREMGGANGKLGCPTSLQIAEPFGRRQYFQRGSLVHSPRQGTNLLLAVYSHKDRVYVEFGPTDPFFYDYFIVDWSRNGQYQPRQYVPFYREYRREGFTSFGSAPGHVEVEVEGCDDGDCDQGWTLRATTQVAPVGAVDVRDVSATTPAQALVGLEERRARATHFLACNQPLPAGDRVPGEGQAGLLAGRLDTVHREGAGFRCEGQADSQELVNRVLRQYLPYATGSTFDGVAGFCKRHGDYDMFLKGLMPIMYRYGHLVYPLTRQHVLDFLLTETGAHSEDDERIKVCGEFDVPETENHRLMIETSKYLSNQLLYDATHNEAYDNVDNGMRGYLLKHLRQFAQHDFLEYNSRNYERLSINALLNLYDFASDPKIRTAAQIALDYATTKFAVSSNQLRRAGPFRRQLECEDEVNHSYYHPCSDPFTAFFMLWTGLTGNTGGHIPAHFAGEAGITTFSNYLPPRTAFQRSMDKSGAGYQQTFYHGNRPRLSFSTSDADPGLEIYSNSPAFLLSAGGVFTNSGYGYDAIREYKLVGLAQSVTLMPTRNVKDHGEVKFEDLIRFRGRYNLLARTNTCVYGGFACGHRFEMPEVLRACAQRSADGYVKDGYWEILNLDTDECGKLGIYVATYIVDTGTAEYGKVGVFYAVDTSAWKETFEKFHGDVRRLNPQGPGGGDGFHTPDGHVIDYRVEANGDKYAALVTKVDGNELPHWSATALAQGPYLSSRGHEGYIEIKYPECGATTVLDYRNELDPSIVTQWGTCR